MPGQAGLWKPVVLLSGVMLVLRVGSREAGEAAAADCGMAERQHLGLLPLRLPAHPAQLAKQISLVPFSH